MAVNQIVGLEFIRIKVSQVDMSLRTVHALDKTGSPIVVNWKAYAGGILHVPNVGETWTAKKLGHQWHLDQLLDTLPQQNAVVAELQPGDTRISTPGQLQLILETATMNGRGIAPTVRDQYWRPNEQYTAVTLSSQPATVDSIMPFLNGLSVAPNLWGWDGELELTFIHLMAAGELVVWYQSWVPANADDDIVIGRAVISGDEFKGGDTDDADTVIGVAVVSAAAEGEGPHSLLYETDSLDEDVGFGVVPGFAIVIGNGQPINTWGFTPAATEPKAGHSVGYWSGKTGAMISGYHSYLDSSFSINSDAGSCRIDHIWSIGEEAGDSFTTNLFIDTSDALMTGTTVPNKIPALFGGNEVEVATGVIHLNSTTGDQSVTGVGFQPDVVLFVCCDPNSVENASGYSARSMTGAVDADGNQWVLASNSIPQSGPTIFGAKLGYRARNSEFRTDSCILGLLNELPSFTNSMLRQRAEWVSMDTDGFTFNMVEAGLSTNPPADTGYVLFLALKGTAGGSFKVGNNVEGDTAITGVGFKPSGIFTVGNSLDAASQAANGMYSSTSTSNCHFGLADHLTQRSTLAGSGSDSGPDGGNIGQYYQNALISMGNCGAQTVSAEAELVSFDSDGFTLDWTTGGSGGQIFGWFVFDVGSV